MSRAYFFNASNWSSALLLSTEFGDGCVELRLIQAGQPKRTGGRRAGASGKALQQPVLRNEAIACALTDLLRGIERADKLRRQLRLARAAARDLGLLRQLRLHSGFRARGIAAGGADQAGGRGRRDALVVIADCDGLRSLDEAARAVGELLDIHPRSLS
jgi:hypothetical protein